ncbi:MAG: ORC-CDC6 family AAA ATPase [Candidatus Omnitrophota bacterium]
MTKAINRVFVKFSKRAEKVERKILLNTFVNFGPLLPSFFTVDNQILYGRRGTGKTHTLIFLSDMVEAEKDIAIYIDLRNIGSSNGIYTDTTASLPERATRLLMDTFGVLHEELLNYVINNSDNFNLAVLSPIFDELASAVTEVMVKGSIKEEILVKNEKGENKESNVSVELSKTPKLEVDSKKLKVDNSYNSSNIIKIGEINHRVHFGRLGQVFNKLCENLNGKRLWVLLDEWSSIPVELQPYLADLLRRSVFPTKFITVKIAAIEKRSQFKLIQEDGEYIGIEVGADASADVNMDDFMVFDNNEEEAIRIFEKLIFKHYQSFFPDIPEGELISQTQLIQEAFVNENVFREFVRASEGIPRDAFYILSLAAQRDFEKSISLDTIRKCSKNWYQRDKESSVSANPQAFRLLHWIIDKVLINRKSRAFLLERNTSHPLIDSLFDSRVLHLLKRNVSATDQPGARYDVYKIDYGCYVDLLSTVYSPKGLFENDKGKFVNVPQDDYRSIRGAILNMEDFDKFLEKNKHTK